MQPLLLDTCAVIWMAGEEKLAPAAIEAMSAAAAAGAITYVSPISAWEIGMLTARGRVKLLTTPERWFQRLFDTPNVRLAEMAPALLIASSFLPGDPPRDPADRIMAATARDYGAVLVTRDRPLLNYGAQGYIHVLAC
jgi:PIN domain nuclease of toxin-antitoxin system